MDSEGDVGDCSLEDSPSSPVEAEHVVGSQNLLDVAVLQSGPKLTFMSIQTCMTFFFCETEEILKNVGVILVFIFRILNVLV